MSDGGWSGGGVLMKTGVPALHVFGIGDWDSSIQADDWDFEDL